MFIFGFTLSIRNKKNSISCNFFKEYVHVWIRNKFKFSFCHFRHPNWNLMWLNNDLDIILNFWSYYFWIFQIHQLKIKRRTLSTSRDNPSSFSFQVYSKHEEHVYILCQYFFYLLKNYEFFLCMVIVL